ncbi:MAG: hypothetical protein WB766_22505, partial [Roseiarcus sp.]
MNKAEAARKPTKAQCFLLASLRLRFISFHFPVFGVFNELRPTQDQIFPLLSSTPSIPQTEPSFVAARLG